MANDQALGRRHGPRASLGQAAVLAWLHGSVLASLVLAATILSWRCARGAVAISPTMGWLLIVALWVAIVVGEGWRWFSMRRKASAIARASRPAVPPAARPHAASDPSALQQLRRDRRPDGREQVAGWMRVDLAAGQRVAQVHVAFCPPLEHAPAIELRQVGGPAARLKLGQALAYGARFELKLAAPGPASITLEYTATAEGAAREPKAAILPSAG